MDYIRIPCQELSRFCEDIFEKCGFTSEEAEEIVDVLMCADLYGIESHGMLLCAATKDGSALSLLTVDQEMEDGCDIG